MDIYYGYTILQHVHWYTRTPLYQTLFLLHCHHYRPTDTLDTVLHVNIYYTTQDTIISCSWSLIHEYSTLSFHVLVLPSHGHSNILNTICYVNTRYIRYHYFMLFHINVSLLHRCWYTATVIARYWITGTRIR